jgi:hypothetical protein
VVTVCSYKKLAISKHKTVNLHESLIEKLNFIKPPNRQFLIGAVELNLPSVGGYDYHRSEEKLHLCRHS